MKQSNTTRARRGATMLLVGISIVVLVGLLAFAVDFGRMYLDRAQVHVSADAAALAGATGLLHEMRNPADSGVAYGRINLVENVAPTITTADVVPGSWDTTTRTFTARGSWTGATAVQATARYTASYRFGALFGLTTQVRRATSVAAVGSVRWTTCVKPFGLPYASVIDILNRRPPIPSPLYTTAHDLTAADFVKIGDWGPLDTVSFTYAQPAVQPDQFDAVKLPDATGGSYNSGAFDDLIAALCSNPLMQDQHVGPGSILLQDNGYSLGGLGGGLRGWCTKSGSKQGGNQDMTCPLSPPSADPGPMRLALVDPAVGNRYRVRALIAFQVTRYDKSTRRFYGFFTTMPASGPFTPVPGALQRIGLVQ